MTVALVQLMGHVAVLLWGLHMVRSGVARACGDELQAWMSRHLKKPGSAFAAGLVVTVIMQSSTATTLMAGGFVSRGYIALSTALVAMLGANLGTSIAARALAFDTGPLSALLLVIGLAAFGRGQGRGRAFGRVGLGLGLMLLALHLIVQLTSQATLDASEARVLSTFASEPLLVMVGAAMLAWLCHSSIAAVLVVCSLERAGIIGVETGLLMVLGANIGSGLTPVFAFRSDRGAFRLAMGALLSRALGCLAVLPILPLWRETPAWAVSDPAVFNIACSLLTAALLTPASGVLSRLLERLFPDRPARVREGLQQLPTDAGAAPAAALARAERQALRMVDALDAMLREARGALHEGDRGRFTTIRRQDDALDTLFGEIESYLSRLDRSGFSEADSGRLTEIMAFAVNLEHAGDVIERSLARVAADMLKEQPAVEQQTLERLDQLFDRLRQDLDIAAGILVSRNPEDARRLFANKEEFRELEQQFADDHFEMICTQGRAAAGVRTLDIARDLKRIEAHIVASARPILAAHDLLRPSRLRT